MSSKTCLEYEILRERWNTLHRANGTSLLRGVSPSKAEREAHKAWDTHVASCDVCLPKAVAP